MARDAFRVRYKATGPLHSLRIAAGASVERSWVMQRKIAKGVWQYLYQWQPVLVSLMIAIGVLVLPAYRGTVHHAHVRW